MKSVRTEEPDSEPRVSTLRSNCGTKDGASEGKERQVRQTATEDRHGGVFATTHWSVVLSAGQSADAQAAAALEQLCRAYWYPLYVFVRRQGYHPEDAQDLTQAFFAHLLSKDFLDGVGPEKGRFRSFLLACLKHFLTDEWEKGRTAKRGGPEPQVPLDVDQAEERYRIEARVEANPESLFERRWALELLNRVLDRLRQDAAASAKAKVFDELQACLMGERLTEKYAQVGSRLGMSETAVKVTVHRLRERFRDLLREEIAHTVAHPSEIEEEMRYLFQVVSR